MTINVRVRDGMCPDPTTGDGGATEGDIRGSFSDIIDVVGVKDLVGGHALVTQNSPTAMSVLVAPGVVYIPNADYDELDSNQVKFWEAIVTVSTTVVITANTSGSTRIDLICVKMDTAITPDEHASNIATLVAVAGTPGAGTPATPDNHYVLATVAVVNGASTIVTGNITSTRVQSKIDFDFLPKATGAEINTGTSDVTIVTPKAIADSKLADYIRGDGWISANETWTYASATTITVPSGAAAKYAKGDKIKLTQGTVKYFYIVGVADTVLTITAGSSYTLTSATISANYYSHASSPIGFPGYFTYTPVISGTGTIPTFSSASGFFSISGCKASVQFAFRNTSGGTAGSGTTDLYVSSPLTKSVISGSNLGYFQSEPNTRSGAIWSNNDYLFAVRPSAYVSLVNNDFNDANNRYLFGFVEFIF